MPLFRIGLPCISVCKPTALCQFVMELNGYIIYINSDISFFYLNYLTCTVLGNRAEFTVLFITISHYYLILLSFLNYDYSLHI